MRISDLVDAIGDRVRVVCGDDRTQEIIRWVHVTDLLEPGRYLRGGELILTNALWYQRPEDAWTFVGDLVAHGVHAVGIALYPGQVLRDGLEQACRHHQVVLLTFDDIAFIDITELVVQRQLEERKDLELRAIELARQLTSAIASGGTGAAFLDILRGELGWDCWFVTGDGVVSSSGRAVTLADGLRAWSASLDPVARRRPLRPITFGDGRTATAIAVPGDWIGAAALALATVVVEAAPERMPATEPVVTDLLRTYLPLAVDRTLTLRALRRGSLATLLVRLESPGRPDAADIEDLLAVMDLSPVTGSGYLVVKVSAGAQHAALPPAVEASCRLRGAAAVATEYGADGAAICLIRAVEADPAQLAAEIWNDLRAVTGSTVAVGISRPATGIAELTDRVHEAAQAHLVVTLDPPGTGYLTGNQSASHLLVLGRSSTEVLRRLTAAIITPIADYDRRYHSDLIHTLQVFLDRDCSWIRTADELHVHVNSLRRRIQRIESLTGRRVADTGHRVDFYLALRAAQLLRERGSNR